VLDKLSIEQIILYYESGLELTQIMYQLDAAEFLKLRYGEPKKGRRVVIDDKAPVKKTKQEILKDIELQFGGRNRVEVK
jgi:hypothetical protein